MEEIFGSHTKYLILMYLSLKGAMSGRGLSNKLSISPSQIFKALHQLESAGIVNKDTKNHLYYLNKKYYLYQELVQIILKESEKNTFPFFPKIKPSRKIDPFFVYQLHELNPSHQKHIKLSNCLRGIHA